MGDRIRNPGGHEQPIPAVYTNGHSHGTMERRAWERHSIDRETIFRVVSSDDPPSRALIRDVSQGGISLLIRRSVHPGTMVRIDLPREQRQLLTSVLACVMRCQPEGTKGFTVGCNFSAELDEVELEEFRGKHVQREPESHPWMNRPGNHGHAEYQRLPIRPESIDQLAEITNFSPMGIGLLVQEEIEPGSVLNLKLKRKNGTLLPVLGCVVYLGDQGEGHWVVGCNFIHELSERDFESLQ